MREVKADISNLDEIISRQYQDKIRGFAKDSNRHDLRSLMDRKENGDDYARGKEKLVRTRTNTCF